MKTTACRHCGRPVAWVRVTSTDPRTRETKTSSIPIDPEQNDRGNVFAEICDGVLIGRVSSKADPRPRGVPFMPHFATCPVLNKEHASTTKPRKEPPPPPASVQPDLFGGV